MLLFLQHVERLMTSLLLFCTKCHYIYFKLLSIFQFLAMLLPDWLMCYFFPFAFSSNHELWVRFKEAAVRYHEQSPYFLCFFISSWLSAASFSSCTKMVYDSIQYCLGAPFSNRAREVYTYIDIKWVCSPG